jgi:hypothetical protein
LQDQAAKSPILRDYWTAENRLIDVAIGISELSISDAHMVVEAALLINRLLATPCLMCHMQLASVRVFNPLNETT